MKTRSVLLYFPGYPFEPDILAPSRPLASLAGSLLEQGHETRILDYGTAETVARLVSGKAASHVERIADEHFATPPANPLQTLHMLWRLRCADRAFRERRAAFAREIAGQLATARGLHFAAFMMNTVEDVIGTLAIVRPLRELCPRLRIVGFGAMPAEFADTLAAERRAFDCLCTGDPETALAALAERIDAPQLWGAIPNIAFVENGHVRQTDSVTMAPLAALPNPAYEPDVYPALKAERKIRVFAIDECRPAACGADAEPPRVRPVASVCNEMWRIGTLFGARAFHFTGAATPASHVSAVAHELLRRGMSTVYTRASSVAHAVPATFPALYASGCAALSFRIETGSQRLLDRYYERGFTITDIERALNCCKTVGIRAIARFAYPCPEDDYHTRAETVRVIDRTRPFAAPIEFPRAAAGYRNGLAHARTFPSAASAFANAHGVGRHDDYETALLHHELVTEIERLGVCASVPDEVLRVSCILGAGNEHSFAARIHREFLRGDAMGIAALVDSVNDVACVPAKRMALRAPDAERLAVGN